MDRRSPYLRPVLVYGELGIAGLLGWEILVSAFVPCSARETSFEAFGDLLFVAGMTGLAYLLVGRVLRAAAGEGDGVRAEELLCLGVTSLIPKTYNRPKLLTKVRETLHAVAPEEQGCPSDDPYPDR